MTHLALIRTKINKIPCTQVLYVNRSNREGSRLHSFSIPKLHFSYGEVRSPFVKDTKSINT